MSRHRRAGWFIELNQRAMLEMCRVPLKHLAQAQESALTIFKKTRKSGSTKSAYPPKAMVSNTSTLPTTTIAKPVCHGRCPAA